MTVYQIVGHRGFPARYPENSLAGLVAAAEAGADCVELDVQISGDNVPMVFHDSMLNRVSEQKGLVWDYSAEQLAQMSAHEPSRFGERHVPCPIPTLQAVCEALAPFKVKVFIEIKAESLAVITREAMLAKVSEACACLGDYAYIISFDEAVLTLAKGKFPIGLVLSDCGRDSYETAQRLSPEILVIDVRKAADPQALWTGPWQWFVYDVVDPGLAALWAQRGVSYIETWDVSQLLSTD